eukprot:TRINITY_DN3586_c0_g1_i2.p1 TRINITY_DN3586_c0_g1~~TRINITY_DN3586_c0_g1_i2.p1  ORF type:complete len:148 (+),score=36.74 TRINITY_DN3586_c0_g1_i2:648-1091(+)
MEMRLDSLRLGAIVEDQNTDLSVLSDDRLRLLWAVNLFSEGFVMWNPNQQVIFVNNSFTQITGFTKEEALSFVGPEFWIGTNTDPISASYVRQSFVSKTKTEVEMLSPKRDGNQYWNRLIIHPILDGQGNLINFYGTFWEIQRMATS